MRTGLTILGIIIGVGAVITMLAVRGGAQAVFGNLNWSTVVYGVTPDYFDARDWALQAGRAITRDDTDVAAKVALLGQTVVQNLFGAADPVGQMIRLKKVPFTVVGVLERKGQSTLGEDQDDVILIPLSTAKKRLLGVSLANPRAVGVMVRVDAGDAGRTRDHVCPRGPGLGQRHPG